MPSYIKSFVKAEDQKETIEDEEKLNSDNFMNFNSNVGLKARLYQKNKKLMESVLSQNSNSILYSEKRDSLLELLNKRDSKD